MWHLSKYHFLPQSLQSVILPLAEFFQASSVHLFFIEVFYHMHCVMNMNMIEVSNLSKTYGHKHAVRNLSFKVNEGELFAFLGPNGSGKSTTIKMLMGLTENTSGDIEILGEQPGVNSISLKKKVSFVPDTPDIMGKLTGKEYLDFVASVYGMTQKKYEEKSEE